MSNSTSRSSLTQVKGTTDQFALSPVLVGPSWKQLSVGGSHVLAIKSNDTLWAWGNNGSGQLGDGTLLTRSSPVLVGGVYTWKSTSAGGSHSLAVRNDGLMFAWGQNSTGQLGNNGVPYSNVWKQISTMQQHTLLIRSDDTLWATGINTRGELGDGTTVTKSSPIQIGTTKYRLVVASINVSVAITQDDRLFLWGAGFNGELGQNDTISRSSPVQIPGSWSQISTTAFNTVNFGTFQAVNTQGQLWAWGNNGSGGLGDGTTIARSSPVQIAAGSSFVLASVGINMSAAISSNGSLFTWGLNTDGRLGTGDVVARSSPTQIGGFASWQQISAGSSYVAALTTTGQLYAWGLNSAGQLGDGTTVNKLTPTLILNSGIKTIQSHGISSTAAITTDNRLLMWGGNAAGELGDGTTISRSNPVQIGNDTNWSSIALGLGTLGLKTDNSLYGWGRDSSYQLFFGINNGTVNGYRSSPVQTGALLQAVSPTQIGTSSWTQVSAGADHSLAIRSDRTLWAFGNNSVGQLLAGGFYAASSPVQVTTSSYSQISAGNSFSLAITTDGALYAGGNNTSGQAGAPPTSTVYSWSQIVTGAGHTLAIRTDGMLFAWGNNGSGQLGDGTTLNRSSPVQIGTNSWISIAATDRSSNFSSNNIFGTSLAVRIDGTVWGTGYNDYGMLGQNNISNYSSFVQVGSFSGMTSVAAGWNHSILSGPGGTWVAGFNQDGQLGDGTVIHRSSPVQISSTNFNKLSAGYSHTVAIRNDGIMFAWGGNLSGELGLGDAIARSTITQVGVSSWTQVFTRKGGQDVTSGSTWAIRTDGKLFAWGYNTGNMLGDGTTVSRSSPVQIGATSWSSMAASSNASTNTAFGLQADGSLWAWGLKNSAFGVDNATTTFTHSWIQINTGSSHAMFIRGDYTLWATGANTGTGAIGDNSTINRSSPVQIGTSAWTDVSAGGQFTLALDSNKLLWSWGQNNSGQLGQMGNENRSSPTQVTATQTTSWNHISAGLSHSLAIDSTGGLYSWGSNSYKQLGQYDSNALSWSTISSGVNYSLYIRSDGKLFGTGINTYGQIGDGTTLNRSSPVQIGASSWNSVITNYTYSGNDFTVGVRGDGTLWAWGINTSGSLGLNDTVHRSSPVQIGTSSWISVAGGSIVTFALRADNTLWAWGTNFNGIFGYPTVYQAYSSPIQVSTKLYSKISTRNNSSGGATTFSLGIDTLGKLYAWGVTANGVLGQGNTVLRSWINVTSGSNYNMFAVDGDNTLWGWGVSPGVVLQYDSGVTNQSSPVQIGSANLNEYAKFTKVTAGVNHGYAISTQGELYGWGRWDVTSGNPTEPYMPIPPAYTWSQISAKQSFTLAIRSDGKLFGWGLNSSGQLGDGTVVSKSAPVQIGNSSWSAVATQNGVSIAIDANKRLFTWGLGNGGALGDNTTVARSSPVQIMTPYSWSSVAAGGGDLFAIRSDNLLFGWGVNTYGALGQNNIIARSSPVQVSSNRMISVFVQTGSANSNSTAYMIRDDYKLFAVGENLTGALGDGTTVSRSSPVQIGTSSWSMIRAGRGVAAAIDQTGRLFTWGGSATGNLLGTNKSWISASLSSSAFGIDYLNRLWAWGDATWGKLGDSTTALKSSPVQIPGSWSQVSTGSTHTIAVASSGGLWSWGNGALGQLGGNSTVSRSSPVQVSSDNFIKIRAGGAINAAINSQGQLFVWGANQYGEAGDSTTVAKSNPVQIGINLSWTDVTIGGSHVAALTNDNRLFVWGDNRNGQVGDGTVVSRSSPVQISGSWSQIGLAGFGSTYAINMQGYLYSWGYNASGELGSGNSVARSSPVQVSAGYPGSVSLTGSGSIVSTSTINFGAGLFTVEGWFYRTSAVGSNTSFWGTTNGNGLTSKIIFNQMNTGELRVWQNNAAALTTSTTLVPQNTWVHIAVVRDAVAPAELKIYVNGQQQPLSETNPSNDYSSITGTFNIGADGEASYSPFPGSISNFRAVTGIAVYTGNFTVSATPLQVTQSSGTNINAITSTQTQLLVASNAPNLYDASIYHRGLTLTNATYSTISPISHSFSQVVGSYRSVYAKSATNNTLWAWGENTSGELGMTDAISRSSPVQIAGFSDYMTNLIPHLFIGPAPTASGMGVLVNNDFLLWGSGSIGQIGDNTTVAKSNPVQVGADTLRSSPVQVGSMSWANISSGTSHTMGITTDGKLYGWGNNTGGQLGTGDLTPRGIPTLLDNKLYSNVLAVEASNNTYRIDTTGKLYAIGVNAAGQLGFNSTIDRSSPVQVSTYLQPMTKFFSGSSFTQVSTHNHTVAIKTDGTLWAWGFNGFGQLGDNTTTTRFSPVQIEGSWSQVAINDNTTIGLKTDGTLWGWGSNINGQFADNSTIHRSSPVQLVSGSSYTQIAANFGSVYGLKINNTLWAWGLNTDGALGVNDTVSRSSPTQVVAVDGTVSWTQVTAYGTNMMAQSSAGTNPGVVFGTGVNSIGQVGDGSTTNRSAMVTLAGTFATSGVFVLPANSVGVFGATARGIIKNSILYTWGQGSLGQLGDNTAVAKSTGVALNNAINYIQSPVQIGTSSWSQVAAGTDHAAAITTDSRLFAWGGNAAGQLGDNTTLARSSPVQVAGSWSQLTAGVSNTLAINTNSTLWAWGFNPSGQLGTNDVVARSSPVQIGTNSWTSVYTNGSRTVAIETTTKSLYGWGVNTSGQLGDNTIINKSSPSQISTSYIQLTAVPTKVDNNSYVQISAGEYQSMAIRNDSTLWGWGLNNFNAITDANTAKWNRVYGGGNIGGLITNLGELYLWGLNNAGQVGDSTIVARLTPTKIGNSSWTMVSFGTNYTLGIKVDGTLWAWGQNLYGNLGNISTVDRSSPVQIGTNTNWTNVTAGYYASVALNSLGQLFTWGYNVNGQLGDNTTVNKSSPIQVGIGNSWITLASGNMDTLTLGAITTDYRLYAWGAGTAGFGDGTTVAKSNPVQILGSWSQVNISYGGIGIRTDNTLWSWGGNTYGELGQNNTIYRSSPVQVTAFNYKQVDTGSSAGNRHVVAIRSDNTAWTWGINTGGQLGDGTVANRSNPTQVGVSNYTFISANNLGTRFIFYDNSVAGTGTYAGNNTSAGVSSLVYVDTSFTQLTSNPLSFISSPTQISSSWSNVSTNFKHTMAIKPDGTLWGWGGNSEGQLGYITPSVLNSLAVNAYIKGDGSLWAWGANSLLYPRVGDNTTISRSNPVQIITGGNNGAWSKVVSTLNNQSVGGEGQSLAIDTLGRLYAWGYNNTGQLGDGTVTSRSLPVQISTSGISWTSIATGLGISAAIRDDSTLWLWGNNAFGGLGQNNTVSRSSPVQLAGSWNMVAVNGQNTNTYAFGIRADKTLWSWGWNPLGILGVSDLITRSSPVQIGTSSWSIISCGSFYAAGGIDINGRLFMWGGLTNITYGVGDNTNAFRSSPVQIMSGRSFTQLSVGDSFAAAIDTNGTLWTWGQNATGELGVNDVVPRSSPVQVGTSSWMMISATGATMFAVLDTGSEKLLYGWGNNSAFGLLGDGTTINKSSPVQISSIFTTRTDIFYSSPVQIGVGNSWLQVATGPYHTVALRNDYTVWTWGMNFAGQLGTNTVLYRSSPVQTFGGGSFNLISAGGDVNSYGQTMATLATGLLYGWGQNNFGQLGDTTTVLRSAPAQIATLTMGASPIYPINLATTRGTTYSKMDYGTYYVTTTKTDGTLFSWGYNAQGQLGNFNVSDISSPRLVGAISIPYTIGASKIGNSSWSQISAGATHALALDATNRLFGWGNYAGNPATASISWRLVKADSVTLGIRYDGTLWVWGTNTSGAIGDSTTISRSSPVQIGNDTDWKNIFPGTSNAAAMKNDGRLFIWGDNSSGQLGDGTLISKSSPVQLSGSWTQISLGVNTTMAQKVDGTWWAWGANNTGQLGNNTVISKSSPILVSGNWKSITAGLDHTTGILYDGTLWTWGSNTGGQLGLNDAVSRSAPTQVGLSTWTTVYAGMSYSVALRTDKTIWAWGQNSANELGDGTVINRSSPVQVGTSVWNSIHAGPFFSATYAFDISGNLYGWGRNAAGQVGIQNATINVSSPVLITAAISFVQVNSGYTSSGIDINGKLYIWGNGATGAIGDNTSVSKSSPVQVTAGINNSTSSPVQILSGSWTHINAGNDFSIATNSSNALYFWGRNDQHQSGTSDPRYIISSPIQIGSSANDTGAGNGTAGFIKNI